MNDDPVEPVDIDIATTHDNDHVLPRALPLY